ncbi:MAG: nicotinate-nucleotide adenylyltransferase [Proteobacteria bacterium]|nr:nicotinate-nucleotide adenylyltransferase [Pseudomonadota bacterium]
MSALVLFGGTFDPVHYGHLYVARDVRAALGVPELRLVPSGDPAHRRPPGATASDRLAMLELAVREFTGLVPDPIEILRNGPSYTVVTLESLRRQRPGVPLAWVVGADAFLGLPRWHRWRRLLELAHIVVIERPGVAFDAELRTSAQAELAALWDARGTDDVGVLGARPSGAIIRVAAGRYPISATIVRRLLAEDPASPQLAQLLPPAVLAYIQNHSLYRTLPDAP